MSSMNDWFEGLVYVAGSNLDGLKELAARHALPLKIRSMRMGDRLESHDARNSKTIERVKGGIKVQVQLRGGMPAYIWGAASPSNNQRMHMGDGIAKVFPASKAGETFIPVPDADFIDQLNRESDRDADITITAEVMDDEINKPEAAQGGADKGVKELTCQ